MNMVSQHADVQFVGGFRNNPDLRKMNSGCVNSMTPVMHITMLRAVVKVINLLTAVIKPLTQIIHVMYNPSRVPRGRNFAAVYKHVLYTF